MVVCRNVEADEDLPRANSRHSRASDLPMCVTAACVQGRDGQ